MRFIESQLGPEQESFEPLKSAEELLLAYRDQALKRARRLLNPLDDHPYLSTIDIAPMANSRVFRSINPAGFSRNRGIEDATELMRRENKNPGNADRVSEDLAQDGYLILSGIVTRGMTPPQPDNSVYTVEDPKPPYKGFFYGGRVYTSMDQLAQDPEVATSLELLNQVIREELFGSVGYSPDQQRALFAAGVGLAQAVSVNRAKKFILGVKAEMLNPEDRVQLRRKHGVRDQVLMSAFRVLRSEGQSGLAEYFTAQKMHEADTRYKKGK